MSTATVYPDHPGWRSLSDLTGGTSRAAAESVASEAKSLRARILGVLQDAHPRPMSADQLASAVGIDKYRARPRIAELHRMGEIRPTEDTVTNESGRAAHLWRIAPPLPNGGANG